MIFRFDKRGRCGFYEDECPYTICDGHDESRDSNMTAGNSSSTVFEIDYAATSSSAFVEDPDFGLEDFEDFEELAEKARKEIDEREHRARQRKKKVRRSRVKQRQGKGHDPRRQVIARVRSHGRGKGRR